jgi:D-alanine-D-alanine ligase
MEATLSPRLDEPKSEEEEPPLPPDMLAECDSDETIAAVGHALQEKHQVVFIESDDKAFGRLKRQRPHLVFNMSERVVGPNRESHIPTVCEMLNIPHTGSDPLTLGICLDKSRAKEILSYHMVPNPAFWIVESASAIRRPSRHVKPLWAGSSKGIRTTPRPEPGRASTSASRRSRDLPAAGIVEPCRARVHCRRPATTRL